jgi:hypothetical protein
MGKIKIIAFYLIALLGLILEIIFLFEIPYYRYSNFLKYLKIVRIIFGFLVFLIDIYFRFSSISEIILDLTEKIREKDKYFQDKNVFYLIDKILIISGFVISLTSLTLNIMGIVSTSDYLSKNNSTDLQNTYSTCSLLLLFENILITICWIYFSIYWGINIHNFRKKAKIKEIDDKKNEQKEEIKIKKEKINEVQNIGSDAPLPPRSLQVPIETSSSEREINN